MKTRPIALLLAASLVLTLAGCGKVDPDTQASPDPGAQETQASTPYDPRGTVLVDRDGLTVTLDEFRPHDDGTLDLELDLENSGNRDLSVSAANCSVNGYMAGVFFSCDVPAGGHAYEQALVIYIDDLTELGVTDVVDVALCFSLDTVDGSHTTVNAAITYPNAALYDYSSSLLQKALANPQWAADGGYQLLLAATEDLYDQDGVSLLTACVLSTPFGTRQLRLELDNRTGERTVVALGDVTVNGQTVYQGNLARCAIEPRKRYLTSIDLDYLLDQTGLEGEDKLLEVGLTVNDVPVTVSVPG